MRGARISCPECGRGPRDDSCGVTIDDRGAVWHCFRCDAAGSVPPEGVADLLKGATLVPAARGNRLSAMRAVNAAMEITPDSVAGRYLQARGCALPPPRSHLRWAENVRHGPSGHVGPALLAVVSDPLRNTFVTLHRTWIRGDGTKADVTPGKPRMYWPGLPKAGVCRLWLDDDVTMGLGLAEGLETALTLARGFVPVWASVDAGNLEAFPVLEGIDALTIAVDHDKAGLKAFEAVAARWHAAGREVRKMLAPSSGDDLNDWVRSIDHAH